MRLGGGFIPDEDLYRIETPTSLLSYRNVAARCAGACFRRDVAMRRKRAELMGIGHPLVDAIITHFTRPSVAGEVCCLDFGDDRATASVRFVIEAQIGDGAKRAVYESAVIQGDGSWQTASVRHDLDLLQQAERTLSPSMTALLSLKILRGSSRWVF